MSKLVIRRAQDILNEPATDWEKDQHRRHFADAS